MRSMLVQMFTILAMVMSLIIIPTSAASGCEVPILNTFGNGAKEWNYVDQTWTDKCSPQTQVMQSPVNLAVQNVLMGPNKIDVETAPALEADNKVSFSKVKYTVRAVTTNSILHVPINSTSVTFQSQYIEYRVPAEHTINGFRFDAELHILHTATSNWCRQVANPISTLVVPLLIDDEAPANVFLDAMANFAASDKTTSTATTFDIRNDLLSQYDSNSFSYIHYFGTLTVPPCTKNVDWYILSQPIRVQSPVIKAFQKYLLDQDPDKKLFNTKTLNARAIQAIPDLIPDKGTFWFLTDDLALQQAEAGDDTYYWAAVWSASIVPSFILFLVILIYGIYKLSSYHRHPRLVERDNKSDHGAQDNIVPLENEALTKMEQH